MGFPQMMGGDVELVHSSKAFPHFWRVKFQMLIEKQQEKLYLSSLANGVVNFGDHKIVLGFPVYVLLERMSRNMFLSNWTVLRDFYFSLQTIKPCDSNIKKEFMKRGPFHECF